MIGFRIENEDLRKNFYKYFQMKIIYWKFDYKTNKYLELEHHFGEPCTTEHFLLDNYGPYHT